MLKVRQRYLNHDWSRTEKTSKSLSFTCDLLLRKTDIWCRRRKVKAKLFRLFLVDIERKSPRSWHSTRSLKAGEVEHFYQGESLDCIKTETEEVRKMRKSPNKCFILKREDQEKRYFLIIQSSNVVEPSSSTTRAIVSSHCGLGITTVSLLAYRITKEDSNVSNKTTSWRFPSRIRYPQWRLIGSQPSMPCPKKG